MISNPHRSPQALVLLFLFLVTSHAMGQAPGKAGFSPTGRGPEAPGKAGFSPTGRGPKAPGKAGFSPTGRGPKALGKIAPPVEKLSEAAIGRWVGEVRPDKVLPKDIVLRGLISNHHTLRAECAMYLATHGAWADIPHLIDALSDESAHVGANYDHMGKHTTRYWANVALIAISKNDYGFRWNDSKQERQQAIERWQQFWEGSRGKTSSRPLPGVVKVEFLFDGESDKPFYDVVLTLGSEANARPFQSAEKLGSFRMDRVLEWLQRDGFWKRATAKPPEPLTRGRSQRYLLRVTSGKLRFTEDLGWGLPMLKRLDSLRTVFDIQMPQDQRRDIQAPTPLDPLLARLGGYRRQWESVSN